jgi:hypothetical protein
VKVVTGEQELEAIEPSMAVISEALLHDGGIVGSVREVFDETGRVLAPEGSDPSALPATAHEDHHLDLAVIAPRGRFSREAAANGSLRQGPAVFRQTPGPSVTSIYAIGQRGHRGWSRCPWPVPGWFSVSPMSLLATLDRWESIGVRE